MANQYIIALFEHGDYDHDRTRLITATPTAAMDMALITLCNNWLFFGTPHVFLGAFNADGLPDWPLSFTYKLEVLPEHNRELRAAKFNRPATVAEVKAYWWPDYITLDSDDTVLLSDMLKYDHSQFSSHFTWLLKNKGLLK